jgi:uncharacterized cupin superfamily protein
MGLLTEPHFQESPVSSATAFLVSDVSVPLKPAPINPSWIKEGTPVATYGLLSQSSDGMSTTGVWECSPGKFDWFYDTDETLYIFEGSIILDEGLPTERRVGPGDVVFFPAGSRAHWNIEKHVRKLAFIRRGLPGSLATAVNVLRRIKNWRSPASSQGLAGAAGADLAGAR